MLTTVVSTEPLPGRMGIGGPIPTTFDAEPSAPPVTPGAAPPGTETAALDPNAGAVKPPVVELRSSSSYRQRARLGHGDAPPQRARSYRREGPGTPHYNLMLSLGGVY